MTFYQHFIMAARIAARDMRGSLQGLWLLVVGIFVGAAAVALVGTTSDSLLDGARRGGLESVGGDISLRLYHRPPTDAERAFLSREGALSITTELRPMAKKIQDKAIKSGEAKGAAQLVELKGVDRLYPLYGVVEISPAQDLQLALENREGVFGAVADQVLFDQLKLKLGDHLKIGGARYQVRGKLITEPDRAFRAFTLGPRIIVSNKSLPATGLAEEGSETYFYTHIKVPAGANTKAALVRIDQAFPQSGWRMVNAHEGVPGVERTLAMAQVLLLFIGLGVMLIGGAGISGAVKAHIAAKMVIIAILKSVGAPPRVVTLAIALEIMAAAVVGTLLGILVGAFGPVMAASALADQLPFALDILPNLKPLLAAGLFGILVAGLFAWWPLVGVQEMGAQVLLRQRLTHPPGKYSFEGWLGAGTILSLLVALVFWVSPLPLLTGGFLIGALALAAFFHALGFALARLAKVLAKGKGANLRLALSNLHREGAPTGPVVTALGLTLTLLVALDGIGGAAGHHVQETLPRSAPDLVAFSLKSETAARFSAELPKSGVVERLSTMPFLHARVQALNGVPVRDLKLPGSMSWVIRGDRGVSFAEELPNGAHWIKNQLQRPGFSLDAGVAKKLGLKLGDSLTLNAGGHTRTGPILNFRKVDWTKLALDFPIIATPVTFTGIPHTFAATVKATHGTETALENLIKERFPDIPLILVADVLKSFANALGAIVSGLETATWSCGLAALVVLAGSVLQGLRARIDEAVLFKVLGARRHQLLGQLIVEFLGLGLLVALVAVPLGLGIAFGVSQAAGLGSTTVSWSSGIMLAATTTLIVLVVGLATTVGAYTATPARVLRNRRV